MSTDLSARYPADAMLTRLRGLPDPVLGELVSTYWGTAFGALQACVDRRDPAPLLREADTAGKQVERRLAQLKEIR